jgi:hypothetical protein
MSLWRKSGFWYWVIRANIQLWLFRKRIAQASRYMVAHRDMDRGKATPGDIAYSFSRWEKERKELFPDGWGSAMLFADSKQHKTKLKIWNVTLEKIKHLWHR